MNRFLRPLLLAIGLLTPWSAAVAESRSGVAVTFESEGRSDTVILPNFWLHVTAGETPTPFLAPGPFTATWRGKLAVDLRSVHSFQAEVNGSLTLDINGQEVLRVTGDGGMSDPGIRVRLNKGTNDVVLRYEPAASGDARLRLFWLARDSYPQLIPSSALSCEPDEAALAALQRQHGREVFIERGCAACHAVEGQAINELKPGAPTFAGLGSRRNAGWLIEKLTSPATVRARSRMPAQFHGGEAVDQAEAVAAYLITLTDPRWTPPREPTSDEFVRAGGKLFAELNCAGCHREPSQPAGDDDRIALGHLRQKFTPGSLAAYLARPSRHHHGSRMPDFRLTHLETGQLAAYLLAGAGEPEPRVPRPELAAHGREIVQTAGCLNCHSGPVENSFHGKPLAELRRWDAGCLSPLVPYGTRRPYFALSDADREALRAFGSGETDSLTRRVDWDYARRQMKALNCAACHERQLDLVPPLELLGGKLKPEWSAAFMAGQLTERPRPWLSARMPSFTNEAPGLARGLAQLHGFPAVTPPEEPVDEDLAVLGYKLINANGGFACISCHGIGEAGGPQIFEAAGINFAQTADRLQHDYFVRWMLNPLQVDPATKMPVFFGEDGASPLFGILRGRGVDQIEAMWHYFRQREDMKIPPGMGKAPALPVRQNSE